MIVGGIFGPKKSGKTTLACHLAREYWNAENRRTLVNDPNGTDTWGPHCWLPETVIEGRRILDQEREERFWEAVWATHNCLIICDDAGKTINRNSELNDVFTRINHNGHKLLVVGHGGTNLNPLMRQQMDVLYLFRTTPKESEKWFEVFGDEQLKQAHKLQQYEFLYVRQYQETQRLILDV
jgi:GTPase SAR1 family protein